MQERPEIRNAASMSRLPRSTSQSATLFTVDGRVVENEQETPETLLQVISTSYFATLESSLERGRVFDPRDRLDTAPVAIVNRAFVDRWLDGGEGLGDRLTVDGRSHEIVGVAADVLLTRMPGGEGGSAPILFLPAEQSATRTVSIAARSEISEGGAPS